VRAECQRSKSHREQTDCSDHAGDDSDGKIWGIEGINILFILGGLVLSVGLSLMLFRGQTHSLAFSFGVGSLPLVLTCVYVFALRQGRPRSYDTDLLETHLGGLAWLPPRRQSRHPIDHNESA